jgi:hypothetical protein
VLIAVGCGGSSTSKHDATSQSEARATAVTGAAGTTPAPFVTVKVSSGKPLTRAQWIAKGDAICTHFNHETAKLTVVSRSELFRVLPQAVAYMRVEVAELARLVPPRSKASEWQEFLNDNLQSLEDISKLVESTKAVSALTSSPLATAARNLRKHFEKVAGDNGFKVCSRT